MTHHRHIDLRTTDTTDLTGYTIKLTGTDSEVQHMKRLINLRCQDSGLAFNDELKAWVAPLFKRMVNGYVVGHFKGTRSKMSLRLLDDGTTLEVSLTNDRGQ